MAATKEQKIFIFVAVALSIAILAGLIPNVTTGLSIFAGLGVLNMFARFLLSLRAPGHKFGGVEFSLKKFYKHFDAKTFGRNNDTYLSRAYFPAANSTMSFD